MSLNEGTNGIRIPYLWYNWLRTESPNPTSIAERIAKMKPTYLYAPAYMWNSYPYESGLQQSMDIGVQHCLI